MIVGESYDTRITESLDTAVTNYDTATALSSGLAVSSATLQDVTSLLGDGITLEDLVLAANYMLGPVDYSKWDNATTLFMHRKALAFSGGGCLSVLSQGGFLHVLNHVTPPDLWNGSL